MLKTFNENFLFSTGKCSFEENLKTKKRQRNAQVERKRSFRIMYVIYNGFVCLLVIISSSVDLLFSFRNFQIISLQAIYVLEWDTTIGIALKQIPKQLFQQRLLCSFIPHQELIKSVWYFKVNQIVLLTIVIITCPDNLFVLFMIANLLVPARASVNRNISKAYT